jgi:lysophospholipase L1-like esterase
MSRRCGKPPVPYLRDPADPQRINPAYDSGDHLHPSDAGYQVMAESIDLRVLR